MTTRTSLRVTILLAVLFVSVACASLPPQTKPASPEAFAGQWDGVWNSTSGPGSAEVDLTVGKPRDGRIDFWVHLTNSRFASWQSVAQFVGGELVVDRPSLWMVFRLHGDNRLEAEYHDRMTGNRGTWSLARKKD